MGLLPLYTQKQNKPLRSPYLKRKWYSVAKMKQKMKQINKFYRKHEFKIEMIRGYSILIFFWCLYLIWGIQSFG